ncbi:MAG TPA: hypothetical protein VGD79_10575, partial [Thermoanaerobaculia bacterium]
MMRTTRAPESSRSSISRFCTRTILPAEKGSARERSPNPRFVQYAPAAGPQISIMILRLTSTRVVMIAVLVAATVAPCSNAQQYGTWGVDISGMDRSVHPGDNFAMFAFGAWSRDTPLPPGVGAIGPRMEMEGRNEARIASIIEESARHPVTANERRIANLYNSYLNAAHIERLDARPLRKDLAAIQRLSGKPAIARHLGRSLGGYGQSFFNVSIGADYDAPQ